VYQHRKRRRRRRRRRKKRHWKDSHRFLDNLSAFVKFVVIIFIDNCFLNKKFEEIL
jgi:hypothetical protein